MSRLHRRGQAHPRLRPCRPKTRRVALDWLLAASLSVFALSAVFFPATGVAAGTSETTAAQTVTGTLPGPFVGHDIRPGAGVSKVRWLSDYFLPLKGTPGDTLVYILEGSQPGGTAFVAGGTHANEIAGILAAVSLVEKGRVEKGRLIVVPHANNSAVTWHEGGPGDPDVVWVVTASGPRSFKYGSRRTNPEHQGPDPQRYVHPSGYASEGNEARNLDRVHPGRADGTLTEQISFALVQLIRAEKVDVAFDLHEAGTVSRLANTLVANPKGADIAAMALLNMDAAGISLKLEQSSKEFRGLSHREWGDATQAFSFLIETPNPGQDSENRHPDVVNDVNFPLWQRVAVQLETVWSVIDAFNSFNPERAVVYSFPRYQALEKGGIAEALN